MNYEKLVRDNIPKIIEKDGKKLPHILLKKKNIKKH